VNRKIRRKQAAEKRKVERRLSDAVEVNESGPVLKGHGIHYEVADRTKAIACGGIGGIHRLVKKGGLQSEIDEALDLLKIHRPYFESDHVLNVAYNVLCGGRVLDDIEVRRKDVVFLDALGAKSIPDPTTAGDFCRRFDATAVNALMDAINATRREVWRAQPASFFAATARIDADGTFVPTHGETKEGMDISYNGVWGYHALVVSLANTGEPLFFLNRSANRPSHEGVVPYYDKAIALCREAGFEDILLRGDTDFSLTTEFDRWDADGVRFIFGFDANKKARTCAELAPDEGFAALEARVERERTRRRLRPPKVKQQIVHERGYKKFRLESEEVVEFAYRPSKASRDYRMVALRKNISVERGDDVLVDEIRYYFYITNDWKMSTHQVVHEARHRCDQENLIQQLKTGIRALHAPVNTLNANWAYMVMAALAWTLKAWVGLSLPVLPRWQTKHEEERTAILRMDFRTFLHALVLVPCQIVHTGRRLVYRLLSWNPWQPVLLRFVNST